MSAFAPLSESQRTSTVSLNYLTTGSSSCSVSKPPGIDEFDAGLPSGSGTFRGGVAWRAMTSTTVVLIPGMLKALRQVRVYGFMVERRDGLYYPGSNQPACSKALAEKMVEGGWLVKQGERYQPTEKGWHAGPHVG